MTIKPEKISRILVIIQRYNGDVFLGSPLIDSLKTTCKNARIDLLVNEDTLPIARTIQHINDVYTFSYRNRTRSTLSLLTKIYRRYDIGISLTASDRSVLFAVLGGSISISAIDATGSRSWWKKILLNGNYVFDTSKHVVINNTRSLAFLGNSLPKITVTAGYFPEKEALIVKRLEKTGIRDFIIFHPSAQYNYKIYPAHLRTKLLELLNTLDIPIIVTGGKSDIDATIKRELPSLSNVYDFIGETSLEELIALSNLSLAYIGNDTMNMHIAAAQNKRIFAIFGPTILKTWSPWANDLQKCAVSDMPLQTYGNVTIFQANMPCVACGLAGCDDKNGPSDCLSNIDPVTIFNQIAQWLKTFQ